jgi:SdrD B-like domain
VTAQNSIRLTSSVSSISAMPIKARIFELSVVVALLAASANAPVRAQAESPVAPSTQSVSQRVAPAVQPQAPAAPNAITGFAFRDKNSDGKRDAGEPGVVGIAVTAFGTDGTTRGTTTTANDGSYSLTASGAGPYRVEFTNFPLFMRPGPQGADSATTVQFVPDGNATNININFVNPDDYVGPTVNLATTLFVAGSQTGTKPALVGQPYAVNSSTGVEQFPIALENQIGTTYGLAYQRSNKTLYAASFVKRGTGFGPGGIGAIYKVPISGTPSVLIDIGSAAGSFSKPRDLNPDPPDFDSEAITLTGKSGFGDLDISEDETTLYTVNLANRSLYKIDVLAANAAPGGTTGVSLIGPHPDPGCVTGVARPFALEIKDGVVYVGGMCTGELGPTQGNTETVEAYVYTYTAASGWGSQPVLRFPHGLPNHLRRCVRGL